MIVCHEHYDFRGGVERRDYEWQGGELAYVDHQFLVRDGTSRVTNRVLEPGDVISVGPLRLTVIDRREFSIDTYIITCDGWKAWVIYVFYHVTKRLGKIYRRLIITAAVWGLADYHDALVPTWRDVYLLRGLSEWIMKHLHGRLR